MSECPSPSLAARQRPHLAHRQGRLSALQARTLPPPGTWPVNPGRETFPLTQTKAGRRSGQPGPPLVTHLHPSQTTSIEMLFLSLLLKPVTTPPIPFIHAKRSSRQNKDSLSHS